MSRKNALESMIAGLMSPAMLIATPMLKIFEPNMFPIINCPFPFLADCIVVTNSGKLVPSAVKVNPITYALTPNMRAILVAPSIKNFDPYISNVIPIIAYTSIFEILASIMFSLDSDGISFFELNKNKDKKNNVSKTYESVLSKMLSG